MSQKLRCLLLVLFLLLTLACSAVKAPLPTPTPSPAVPPAPLPSVTTVPSPTPLPATLAPTAAPTQPLPSPTRPPKNMRVQIFLIAIEDNGISGKKIGCNDSAIPVEVEIPYTQGVLRAALDQLLSLHDTYYGESGLYNALAPSDLMVKSLSIKDGLASIHLIGQLSMGGMCDSPRVLAQLEETARQFSTVEQVEIFVNDKPLKELLSDK